MINPYRGPWVSDFYVPASVRWNITLTPDEGNPRSFAAIQGPRTWTENNVPVIPNSICLYAGYPQGGKLEEARDPTLGSTIEGHYEDYITGGLFETNFAFSQYSYP